MTERVYLAPIEGGDFYETGTWMYRPRLPDGIFGSALIPVGDDGVPHYDRCLVKVRKGDHETIIADPMIVEVDPPADWSDEALLREVQSKSIGPYAGARPATQGS